MTQPNYYDWHNHVCVFAFASNLAAGAFFFAVGALHPLYETGLYHLIAYSIYAMPFVCLLLGWVGCKWATDSSGKKLAIAAMVLSVLVFALIISVPSTFLFPDPETMP